MFYWHDGGARIPRRDHPHGHRMKQLTTPLALCAVLVTAARRRGCGGSGGVPGDAVATVDGVAIEKQAFDHWLAVTAKTNERAARRGTRAGRPAAGLRPLDRRPRPRTGASPSTTRPVKRDFERQKKLSFPHDAEYQRYLETSGQTEKDILERVRIDVLSSRIRDQVTGGEPKITQRAGRRALQREQGSFSEPEQRDVERRADADTGAGRRRRGRARRAARHGRRSREGARSTGRAARTAASCSR